MNEQYIRLNDPNIELFLSDEKNKTYERGMRGEREKESFNYNKLGNNS